MAFQIFVDRVIGRDRGTIVDDAPRKFDPRVSLHVFVCLGHADAEFRRQAAPAQKTFTNKDLQNAQGSVSSSQVPNEVMAQSKPAASDPVRRASKLLT